MLREDTIMSEVVKIYPYDKVYDDQLMGLSVAEEQLPYVGKVEDLLLGMVEGWTYNVICFKDEVVGFFNIDKLYSNRYEFATEEEIGFRAFFIDKRYQGKGIGSKAMKQLREYVSNNYPGWKNLVLTVNCRNEVAYKLYTKYGFEDNGELYHGGKAGPQHVLRMRLI